MTNLGVAKAQRGIDQRLQCVGGKLDRLVETSQHDRSQHPFAIRLRLPAVIRELLERSLAEGPVLVIQKLDDRPLGRRVSQLDESLESHRPDSARLISLRVLQPLDAGRFSNAGECCGGEFAERRGGFVPQDSRDFRDRALFPPLGDDL